MQLRTASRQKAKLRIGLAGPNCRHSIMPFWQGISKKTYWDLPNKNKIKANYINEQLENVIANQRRKVKLEQRLLKKSNSITEFEGKK